MKTIARLALCLFLAGTVSGAFAQQAAPAAKQTSKKQKSAKQKKEIDNKIAVSDEAQTADKGAKSTTKSTTKKEGGISNK